MVSPHDPAVEVSPEGQTESPETARAKALAASLNALEQALDPQPRPIAGKRAAEKLADSRRLLESRIASDPDFERHSRKCQVCHSRWVEEIEEAYFNWSSAQWIINSFNISYDDAVYRHARALGLDVKRRKNVVVALEKLIEKVDEVTVTSSTVIRAVRALSCLDATGRWTDLPTTHVVVTTKAPPSDTNTTAAPPQQPPMSHTGAPNNESRDHSVCSTERSEPSHENDSGFPEAGSTDGSHTGAPNNESRDQSVCSTERSEPHRASDTAISADRPSSKIKPQACPPRRASSLEHPERNRGTYEKLEIPATD